MVGDGKKKAATRLRQARATLGMVPEIGLTDDQEARLREIKRDADDLTEEVEADVRRENDAW